MTSIRRRSLLLAGGGAAAAFATGVRPASAATAVHDSGTTVVGWNQALLRIVRTPGAQPATVHATRSFAMLHAALYDAVGAAGRRASRLAAGAQAAHDTLVALYPAAAPDLATQLAGDLALVPDPAARDRGVRVGALTARLLLALRAGDGSDATPPPLAPGTEPGRYRPTPPGFAPAVFTHWPRVRPFVLRRADQFRPEPYPALASAAYAGATNEVQSLGSATSTSRDADGTVQAKFWAAPIWNYWNEIAQQVTAANGAGLTSTARAFARLNLAFADAVIAFYEAKYHYLVWRPITAVRLADTDGNPATIADPGWNPLANTPADPAYPGAHSVIARAGAEILGDAFGDRQRLTVTSEVLPGVTRTFTRLRDAAEEAGQSRIFAGVHTRLDHEAGRRLGGAVARFTLAHT